MASEAKERTSAINRYEALKIEFVYGDSDKADALEALREFVREVNAACERAEAAEQQLATERARHASMAAEFEKIAKGEHPRYWTLEPGDVLLRPTGETRKVRGGEWFRNGDDRYIRHDGYLTVCKFPIYRRIDAPAAAEPLPPPVSEQPDAGELVHQAVIDTLLSVLERTEAVDDDEYGCLAKTAALLRNGIIELRYTEKSKPAPPVSVQEGERRRNPTESP